MNAISLVFLLAVLSMNVLHSQHQQFNVGMIGGLNFATLTGEEATDYFGLNGGLIGSFRYTKSWSLGIELLYSVNGEYVLPIAYPDIDFQKVRLRHVEVPIHLDWLIDFSEKTSQVDGQIQVGLAYAQLFNFVATDMNGVDVRSKIIYDDRHAFVTQLGIIYNFSAHWGLNLKASLPIRLEALSWTFAVRLVYHLRQIPSS